MKYTSVMHVFTCHISMSINTTIWLFQPSNEVLSVTVTDNADCILDNVRGSSVVILN